MYRGDGSYKSDEKLEACLYDLIDEERQLADAINTLIKSKEVLANKSTKSFKIDDDLEEKRNKIFETRVKIKAYIENII